MLSCLSVVSVVEFGLVGSHDPRTILHGMGLYLYLVYSMYLLSLYLFFFVSHSLFDVMELKKFCRPERFRLPNSVPCCSLQR
jgi:hypothetical protein